MVLTMLAVTGIILALYALRSIQAAAGSGATGSGATGSGPAPAGVPPSVWAWADLAQRKGALAGVPWRLVLAVIWQESAGDPAAVGAVGEVGLMQVRDAAAEDVAAIMGLGPGRASIEPNANVEVGAGYLALSISRAAGDTFLGLRMYNAGPTGARRNAQAGAGYAADVLDKLERLGG